MVTDVPILDDLRELVRKDKRPRRQIAIAAGIHETTFTAFMSGRRGLSIETAEKLADVLGAPMRLGDAVTHRPPPIA
jgi:plasmid maintenance system antidote protein VapI